MKEEKLNKILLEKYILNNPFDFKNGIINQCRQMDKLDVYEWIAEDELKINDLQSQLKAKEELIKEIKNHCEIEINASNHYLENHKSQKELCHKVAHQRILEILSKGENK